MTTKPTLLAPSIVVDEHVDPDAAISAAKLAFLPAGTGAAIRDVQTKLRDSVSARDFGAVGDGATDDAAAIQSAINYAAANGYKLKVPAGVYRLGSRITILDPVYIEGEGALVTISATPNEPAGGTWFHIDHTGEGFRLRDGDAVGATYKFCDFANFGIMRNQPAPGAGWAPTANDFDLRVEYHLHLQDVFFLNSTKAAYVRSGGVLSCDRVRGHVFDVGFEVERSADVQRWHDVHWWPYWSLHDDVTAYTIQNAVGFEVQRSDGLQISDAFSIYLHRLFRHQDSLALESGLAGFRFKNMYADGCGGGLEFTTDHFPAYGSIDGVVCNSDASVRGSGSSIMVSGAEPSTISVNSFDVTRSHEHCVVASGAAHTLFVQANHLDQWNRLGATDYALLVNDGARIRLANDPVFGTGFTGDNLLYSIIDGDITIPVRHPMGSAAIVASGLYSRRVTIADDGVAAIAAPVGGDRTCVLHLTPLAVPSAGNPAGMYWLRCTGSPGAAVVSASHTANVTVTTGVLTGTTGTDGDLTISADGAGDGTMYIENRTGGAKTFLVTLLGR